MTLKEERELKKAAKLEAEKQRIEAMREYEEMYDTFSYICGIDEAGRDKIEEIYAQIFKAEDSLVRSQLISGSHALAITLQGLLRPNDTMISITGLPYDTLQTVIGIGENLSLIHISEPTRH